MAHRSVIPFGPQHPVLPEPLHLDLVIEDDRVIEAIPQIGFVHRGLEKLTEKRDMHQFGYTVEKEAKYTVRFKWLYGGDAYLTDKHFANWCDIRNDREEIKDNLQHTRKELEEAGFEWVFDCPGVEVKEVDDGND